jgi:tRNA modification GTPase
MPEPRTGVLATLRHSGSILDRALCFWFPGPASATGEDVVELHLHGGIAVVRSVLSALADHSELRLAEPGEFTRRGFLNGKLDLTQAEGLADLIDAETEHQASQALSQMEGSLGRLYESWRERIVRGLAYAEAVLDFPDEDVPDSAALKLLPELQSVMREIELHLADGHRGEIVRDGLSVAILGRPNAGKSSLLNALARRDVAIVSDIAGTTRDVLEVRLNLGGYAVILADTAGLRETTDQIESEGIRRALVRAEESQVRILVADPETIPELEHLVSRLRTGDIVVWNKADLDWRPPSIRGFESLVVSTKTGQGLAPLVEWLARRAGIIVGVGQGAVITRSRHREALLEAVGSIRNGIAVLGRDLDLAAEDLRIAARSIGRITGRVDVEDILDIVFRDFCIGK